MPVASVTDDVLGRLRSGDTRTLARAISAVEDSASGASEILTACAAVPRRTLRIGITGPPGAGKSTLVDRLVRSFRAQAKTVAVLAVDPSSPYTGGALLGDRIRMESFAADPGVYFRSMASRGATGGLAARTAEVCSVIEAAGFDILLIETVGAGQAEVEVASLADVTLVVLIPGLGDDVQSLKAGILEIADLFVINKADHPGAERVEAELLAMQGLAPAHPNNGASRSTPKIVRTTATTGEGIEALMQQIDELVRHRPASKPRPAPADALRLDHIGIAVRSIAAARTFYSSLGLAVTHEETVEHEQVHTAMLPLGETRLELLEATAEDSTIGRYIAKRGEGLHHLAIHTAEIEATFARLRADGVRLASDSIRTGAGGHRYFFIHPQSTGGILLEIVGE